MKKEKNDSRRAQFGIITGQNESVASRQLLFYSD